MCLSHHIFQNNKFYKYLRYEVDYVLEMLKIQFNSKNAPKILQKIFVFKIIAFEMVAGSSPYHDENTHHMQ